MKHAISNSGVLLAGIFTTSLTVLVVSLFNSLTGFNIFSFSLWLVVPVGAALCGALGASGYYLASIVLHRRPTPVLLIQMVVVAAIAQLAFYYVEYAMMSVEGVRVASVLSFTQYLDLSLTHSHYRVGRGLGVDTGEVGSFGYWLAFFQFVGFLIGAIFLYFILKNRLFCDACNKYFSIERKKEDHFTSQEEFAEYYDGEFADPVDSSEFAERVGWDRAGEASQGTIRLTTQLLQCPGCSKQLISETVAIHNGQDWKDVNELSRSTLMPAGFDAVNVYGGLKPTFLQSFAI